LDILSKQAENRILEGDREIKKEVRGYHFCRALRKYPKILTTLRQLGQAGEIGGCSTCNVRPPGGYIGAVAERQSQVCDGMPLSDHLRRRSVVVFLMIFVIPVFAQMFQDFGGTLPWPTQLVIGSTI
jgi:type IV pilus assembly protein PilC